MFIPCVYIRSSLALQNTLNLDTLFETGTALHILIMNVLNICKNSLKNARNKIHICISDIPMKCSKEMI